MIDIFKYILDESKHNGFTGIISIIIKLAAIYIYISPISIYFLLYQPELFSDFNIISCIVALGLSSIFCVLILLCSKEFATLLLLIRINFLQDFKSTEEKKEYYFKKTFMIATVFQLILSIFLILIYYINHPSVILIEHLKELNLIIVIIILFILLSVIIRAYVKKLCIEQSKIKDKTPENIDIDNQSYSTNETEIINKF